MATESEIRVETMIDANRKKFVQIRVDDRALFLLESEVPKLRQLLESISNRKKEFCEK